MTARGDVVIVQFPYQDATRGKNRPALVVQCDENNRRLQNTIISMITGNIQRARTEPTQLLVDPSTPEGQSSGLHGPSAVKCENLFTVSQADILRTIGRLSPGLMVKVDACLKASLGVE
ncbi:MAG: type II toxin-antitoxin system PemK/MazF family toxin [Planctomycetota bacterium]